jgi:FixJ family two-component response regulator
MPIKPAIAVIDDDEAARKGTTDLLRSLGFIAKAFPCGDDFLKSERLRITSCLIADLQMPGMSGLELYGRLVALGHPIPTILTTAFPDERVRARALNVGVTGYLTKPFGERELLDCIDLTLKQTVLLTPVRRQMV